jgi:hypothetical protein
LPQQPRQAQPRKSRQTCLQQPSPTPRLKDGLVIPVRIRATAGPRGDGREQSRGQTWLGLRWSAGREQFGRRGGMSCGRWDGKVIGNLNGPPDKAGKKVGWKGWERTAR